MAQPDVQTARTRVTIKFFGEIKHFTGESQTVVELPAGSKVIDLLKILSEKYGKGFTKLLFAETNYINPGLMILVNNSLIYPGKPDIVIETGNIDIAIIPVTEAG